jgi:hypothetical protein
MKPVGWAEEKGQISAGVLLSISAKERGRLIVIGSNSRAGKRDFRQSILATLVRDERGASLPSEHLIAVARRIRPPHT